MVSVTLAGRSFEIAPYKLGALRKAAPHIDAINSAAGDITTIAGMMESAAELVAVLAIGIAATDPTVTADTLLDALGVDDLPALYTALTELLRESGLAPKGEATAPSEPATVGASPSSSETSSAN